jgi:hypothetical protein
MTTDAPQDPTTTPGNEPAPATPTGATDAAPGADGDGDAGGLRWTDPRTVFGLVALLALFAFVGYLSSRADSWARLMATYNGFVPLVTAIIGGVVGVQVTGNRVKDATAARDHAQQRRQKAESSLAAAKQTLAKAQVVLDGLRAAHDPAGASAASGTAARPARGAQTRGEGRTTARTSTGTSSGSPPATPVLDHLTEQAGQLSGQIGTLLSDAAPGAPG